MNQEPTPSTETNHEKVGERGKPGRAYEWRGDVRFERLRDADAVLVKQTFDEAEVDSVGLRRFMDFVLRHSDLED